MYMTYEEYQAAGGRLPYEAFTAAEPKAEAQLRLLTMCSGRDIFAAQDYMVRLALVETVDIVAQDSAAAASRQPGTAGIKSESNDGYSVTYASDGTEGMTASRALQVRILDAVRAYLAPGNWLYRGLHLC